MRRRLEVPEPRRETADDLTLEPPADAHERPLCLTEERRAFFAGEPTEERVAPLRTALRGGWRDSRHTGSMAIIMISIIMTRGLQ